MKTIESRLNDLKGKLKPDTSNVVVIMMIIFIKMVPLVDSYFENKEEKEAFLIGGLNY